MNMKVYVIFLLKMLTKIKTNLFENMSRKLKLNFFSNKKLNFKPRTYNYSVNNDVNSSVLFNENCSG